MRRRGKSGRWRHRATFQQHDGTQDSHGIPTYNTAGDWDAVLSDWPCQMKTTNGDERLRGGQVTSETTHVLYGDYASMSSITTDMRAVVTSSTTGTTATYQIISVLDLDGEGRELRVELKKET